MWKWISGVLVLANVAVFGVLQMQEKPREVDVSAREMNAEQVRPLSQKDLIALKLTPEQGALLSASTAAEKAALEAHALESEDAPKAQAEPKVEAKTTAAAPQAANSPSESTVSAAAQAAEQAAAQAAAQKAAEQAKDKQDKQKFCYHWGDFDEGAAARAKQRLIRAGLGSHVVEIVKSGGVATSASTKFWVYMPKSGDRESSVRRVLSLREKGFEAFVVNQRGEFEHAISLGLFSKKASADALIAKLSAAGIADVKLHLRGGNQEAAPSGKISYLRLKALNPTQKSRLETLSSEWPQASLKNIPCH